MSRYSPMEDQIIRRLTASLVVGQVPVRSIRIFGSRARGHSNEGSDLDIVVELASPPDSALSRRVMELGRALSVVSDDGGWGLRVQAVPLFEGEEQGPLARAIARDAETVWTRT